MSLLGGVLAGGSSTRMGTDKASVVIDGSTMLERVSAALSEVTDRVVVLGEARSGYECWPDDSSVTGPLAGIATALTRMEEERALIVAVDNPFVAVPTLRGLGGIDSALAVVPVDDEGIRQVTCAVYPKTAGDAAVEEALAGGSVQTLLDRVSFSPVTPEIWRQWGEDGRSWFSVDTARSIQTGLERYGV
jgi:molybdopterin-guanine dinucleotide biosynthesis protein A